MRMYAGRIPSWGKWFAVFAAAFLLFAIGIAKSENPAADKSKEIFIEEQRNENKAAEDNPINLQQAHVSRAIDGDTIVVNLSGKEEKIRLIGVNTPESTIRHEPYGEKASAFTKKKLTGRVIYLEKDISERDKYGRLLRYVWLEPPVNLSEEEIRRKLFNAVLVLEGHAQVATYPPDVKYADHFIDFENEARKAEKGLWKQ